MKLLLQRQTIFTLFGIDVGLLTAAGTLKAFERYSTAHFVFLIAVTLFPLAVGLLLAYCAERLLRLQAQDDLRVTPRGELRMILSHSPPLKSVEQKEPPWTDYTKDVFESIIWRWHYKSDIDNTPRDIKPFCIECERETPLEIHEVDSRDESLFVIVRCPEHFPQFMIQGPWHAFKSKIKEQILEKLNKGTWVDVVNRQRALKQLPPITIPVDTAPPKLETIPTQILTMLAYEGGESDEPHLYTALDFFFTNAGEPEINRVAIKYHLQDLEQQKKFIWMTHDPELNTIALTQAGRKYVLDNNLCL